MARVLVVENDPLAARQKADAIDRERGHEVVIAASIPAARAAAAAVLPDIVVIDGRLANLADAGELLGELRARDPHLAVLVTPVAAELLPHVHAALDRSRLERRLGRLERELADRERALSASRGQAERATAQLASTSSELATATERLVVAEQLAAVGRVLTGIAHELGQQLALVGYAEALKSKVAGDAELVELADVIVRAQKRLLAMVDTIRDFSGGGDARPIAREPADLAAVVDEALALVAYDRDVKRCRVIRRLTAHPLCALHHDKMTQVVINLVHNAALASEAGGQIEVAVEDERGAATLIVADRGAGMAPDVLARLGAPFFTTRGDRGSGLGVGICKRIVEEHGGTLTFESAPGRGTTARVRLPTLGDP